MQYVTKFNIGDTVFRLDGNSVTKHKVTGITIHVLSDARVHECYGLNVIGPITYLPKTPNIFLTSIGAFNEMERREKAEAISIK